MNQKIAIIIGDGPAGLTAAYYLAKKGGHTVTIFESLPQPGGMMRTIIPEYNLPRDILDAEIETLSNLGIEIITQSHIESTGKLLDEGYDTVLLAIGAQKGVKLNIDGENEPGVIDGISFLSQVNSGQKVDIGENVAVVGNSSISVYAARSALRLGAKTVTIISSTTMAELSVPSDEVSEALAEGIEIKPCASPNKITMTKDKLKLECAPIIQRPSGTNGSAFSIDVDNVIVAIGGTPDIPDQFGLAVNDTNAIQVNPDSLMTSKQGIFASGGAVTRTLSFIDAVAKGKKAAMSIDHYLGGNGNITELLATITEEIPRVGRIANFAQRQRKEMPSLSPTERIRSFAQSELGFTDELGSEEAKRCMGCDLRFAVSRMVASPEYKATGTTYNLSKHTSSNTIDYRPKPVS